MVEYNMTIFLSKDLLGSTRDDVSMVIISYMITVVDANLCKLACCWLSLLT